MGKNKMIKLIDILKEINILSKPELGSGGVFTAYPSKIDPSKVIKISNYNNPKDIQYHADMFRNHPKYFPKVYKVTGKYLVIEKLNIKPIIEYYNKLKSLTSLLNPFKLIPFYNPKKFDPDNPLDVVIKQHPELLEMTLKLKKLYKDVDKILEKEGYDELDFHQENIGIDDKGNFKMLDF
jgi:hypothetical protein